MSIFCEIPIENNTKSKQVILAMMQVLESKISIAGSDEWPIKNISMLLFKKRFSLLYENFALKTGGCHFC